MISSVPNNGSLTLTADSLSLRPSVSVKSGMHVRGDDWNAAINTLMFLNGYLGTVVAAHNPIVSEETTDVKTLRYRIVPRANCIARLWILGMTGGALTSTIAVRIPESAVSANATFTLPGFINSAAWTRDPVFVVEEVADPTEQEISISFTPTAGMIVHSVQVVELPRQFLGTTSRDIGATHPSSVAPGQRIQNRGTAEGVNGGFYSLAGIARSAEEAGNNARRAALFAWSAAEEDVSPYSSTSWSDVFTGTPILGRKRDNGDATTIVRIAVRAEITAGGGDVRFTMQSGDTATITADGTGITGDDPPWYFGTIEIDCDDFGEDGYGQASRPTGDIVSIDYRAASGGTIAITSILLMEAPSA